MEHTEISIDITHKMRELYLYLFNPEVATVKLVQNDLHMWLETFLYFPTSDDSRNLIVKTTYLESYSIMDDSVKAAVPMFSLEDSIEKNANKFFTKMDLYTLIHNTDLVNPREVPFLLNLESSIINDPVDTVEERRKRTVLVLEVLEHVKMTKEVKWLNSYYRTILAKISERECTRITQRVIRNAQQNKDLSCEDSILKSLWDEYCVDIQYEQSAAFDVMEIHILSVIMSMLQDVDVDIKKAIWIQTREGEEELDNLADEILANNKYTLETIYWDDDIARHILYEYVNKEAANWSNDRISQYSQRYHS